MPSIWTLRRCIQKSPNNLCFPFTRNILAIAPENVMSFKKVFAFLQATHSGSGIRLGTLYRYLCHCKIIIYHQTLTKSTPAKRTVRTKSWLFIQKAWLHKQTFMRCSCNLDRLPHDLPGRCFQMPPWLHPLHIWETSAFQKNPTGLLWQSAGASWLFWLQWRAEKPAES